MSDYQEWTVPVTVRGAAILTNSYVAGTVIENVQLQNQLILEINFTKGSLTSGDVKVETCQDPDPSTGTFAQQASVNYTAGAGATSLAEYNFTASGVYRIPINIKDRHIKVSAKGTGTVTDSSMAIRAVVGVA